MKLEKLNPILIGFFTNIAGTLAMFAVTIFLTNRVAQNIYGEFRLVFSFISLLVVLLLLGRDNGLVYYVQTEEDENKKNKIISEESFFTLFILVFGTVLLAFLKTFIISSVFDNKITEENYLISLLILPLWGFFNIGIAGLRAKLFINYSFTLVNLVQRFIRAPFFILIIYFNKSFFFLSLSMILSQCVLLFIIIKKLPNIIHFKKVNIFNFFKRFSYSLQLGLSSIIFVVLSKIDLIMLGNITSVEDVAVYDICVLLSFVVVFPYLALVKSSEPIVKSIIKNNSLLKKYNTNLTFAISISTIIVLCFCLFSDLFLSIFGENYSSGKVSLIVLSIGYLFVSFLASPIEFLNMSGFVKISVTILIVSLVLNIFLNYTLIKIIGIDGASIATIISLIFSKIVALYFVKKKMNMKLINYFNILKILPVLFFILLFFLLKQNINSLSFYYIFFVKTLFIVCYLITFYKLNKKELVLFLRIN